jgi:hypothetical protein
MFSETREANNSFINNNISNNSNNKIHLELASDTRI